MISRTERTLYSAVTPKAITSSTDANPIVMTVASHGFSTGDRILIYGHTTNIAANGIYKITVLSANTFSLQDEITGANIAGSGGGAGASGVAIVAPPVLLVTDYRNIVLQVSTAGSATVTLKVAGSVGRPEASATGPRYDYPNMGATVIPANPYTFLQIINLDTAAAVNGATGIVASGTDINNQYEVNINVQKYLTVFPISWTQGAITVKAILTSNA